MKGVKYKCFGLLLLLSIMLGLSLNTSSDVSALRYAYNAFPIYRDIITNENGSSGDSLELGSRFYITFDSDTQLSYDPLYSASGESVFNLCDDPSLNDSRLLTSSFNSSRNEWVIISNQSFHKFAYNPNNYCTSYIPRKGAYSYSFDSIYTASYNVSNGDTIELVDLANQFFDLEDTSYDSGSIKELSVPLYLDSTRFNYISANTQLEWDFGLVQKSANNFPYLSSSFIAKLNLQYLDSAPSAFSLGTKHDIDVSCSIDRNYRFQTRSEELWEDFLGFNVHCVWTPSSDVYYLHPSIYIAGDNSVNPPKFLDYNYSGIYYTGSYFITDGDDTWSGEYANAAPTGENLESTPGYHQLYGYPESDVCNPSDWLCGLSNLFSFNTFNPFLPIYSLFSSQDSCAHIPTLAGMLHSNETQVCPWFSSQTRQIVTPVLGLSSMMLIFGFFVRWLGSSSGNFFEDSSGETLTYSNWASDGRGFHRTQGSKNRRINK